MSSSDDESREVVEEVERSGEESSESQSRDSSRTRSRSGSSDSEGREAEEVEVCSSDQEVVTRDPSGEVARSEMVGTSEVAHEGESGTSRYRTDEHYADIQSTVTQLELDGLRTRCHIPPEYTVRIPDPEERMHDLPTGAIAIHLATFYCGFRIPIPLPVGQILTQFKLNPTQLLPNSYALLLAFIVLMRCMAQEASFSNFVELFSCQPSTKSGTSVETGFYYLMSRRTRKVIEIPSSSYGKGWKKKWVIVEPPSGRYFGVNRRWVTGKLVNKSIRGPSWGLDMFERILKLHPLRPQELCVEEVLARAGLSPAEIPGVDEIELGPNFIMAARLQAMKEMERKRGAGGSKTRSAAESSQAQGSGAGKSIETPPSKEIERPLSRGKGKEPEGRLSLKRSEPSRDSVPPAKRLAVDRGKASASDRPSIPGPLPLPRWTPEQIRERVWELPAFDEPERFPGVPNDTNLMSHPVDAAAWESFRSTIFPQDIQEIERWDTSSTLRVAAHMAIMSNQLLFQLGDRANTHQKEARRLERENRILRDEGSKKKVEALQTRVDELEQQLSRRDEQLSKAEDQIVTLVTEKTKAETIREQLQRDALDALHRGEELGRQEAIKEKEEEYRNSVPLIRYKSVEDFVRGPVFQQASLMLGANDADLVWKKALGQLRVLGVEFDESKLDDSLDEDLQPYPPLDPEDALPDVEGHEFERILDLVQDMADRAREKEEKRLAEKRSSQRAQESSSGVGEPSQVVVPTLAADDVQVSISEGGQVLVEGSAADPQE